jgi:hypothetical protein
MADAPDSKSGRGNPVRVQVPPPAPIDPQGSMTKRTGNNFLVPFPSALSRGHRIGSVANHFPLTLSRELLIFPLKLDF